MHCTEWETSGLTLNVYVLRLLIRSNLLSRSSRDLIRLLFRRWSSYGARGTGLFVVRGHL